VIERVISGGQTGVDRAALDVAMELGTACGGWCPRGRRAEDGRIPDRYPLRETPSAGYAQRTEWNVGAADATLVLHRGRLRGGTALTVALARRLGKPWLAVDLAAGPADVGAGRAWLDERRVAALNVAGPRESLAPGIAEQARAVLRAVLGGRVPPDNVLART
jgi:hypothetical protein